ncbi:MAG: glycosyltransferase family 4 protein [Candidatus Brocadiia bacterium]
MRITFLAPHIKISGGVKIICEYARRLARLNHKVTLVVKQPRLSWLRNATHSLIDTIGWIDLKPVRIIFVPSFESDYIPDADIIMASSWKTAAELNNIPDSKGRKFYLIQHMEGLVEPADLKQVEATYAMPFRKIAVSGWLRDELKNKYGQPSDYVPNAIDEQEFFPSGKTYGTLRLGMLYHTADWKGLADGVEAINKAFESFPDVKVVLFGARNRRPAFNQAGFKYDYFQNADGAVLRNIYSSCDVFICPSWYEGFGLPGLEAMACGTALATTDNGGCRDYAIHNRTALVSAPKNPAELAESIIRLLKDRDLLKSISENGYQMSQKFRWDNSVSQMERILCQV